MSYLVFILGLVFGSFLNVVIYRLKKPTLQLKSGFFGRSMCLECRTSLKWYDLMPLLSFLYLRGRCRYCRKKISWQYPTVEILSGLIWILVFSKNLDNFQFPISNFQLLNTFYEILIFSALLVIAVCDFKWKIIPDKIVYPVTIVVFLYNVFNSFKFQNIEILVWPLSVAVIAFLFFFLLFYFSHGKAMGLGDAKLAVLIALFLNPLSTAVALTLAFIFGATFGIILVGLGKKTLKSQVAFGPFLVTGAIIAFFLSDLILSFIIF
ncbi:MAG: prepilin peptidase [Parcubacteria group bacterium]|nr:prepilin peptidase [Parcubacteria group bacterium]